MIYSDKTSNFEELLTKDNSVSIHHSNIHALAIEMYKVANDMSPDIMNEVFKLKNTPHYNLRHTSNISTDPIHSDYNGIKWASYLGPKIWEQTRAEIKNKDSLDGFKKAIKKWKPTECPCWIFKVCAKFRFCLIKI